MKTGTLSNRGGWLKDPRLARPGEVIGGGWFVFRRGDSTNRIRPSMWPFEYSSREDAAVEATKLAAENPGYTFIVVGQTDAATVAKTEAA